MVKRLSDKQEIEGSIPSRCIRLVWRNGRRSRLKICDLLVCGFKSLYKQIFQNIDSLMVERLSHNQEVEGSIPSRCIFLGVA